MRKTQALFSIVIALANPSWAWSASIQDARQLHEQGRVEEAVKAIEDVLDSDATDSDKAEALDLLGTIAVERGHLTMAEQAWQRLVSDYPEFAEGADVRTKLLLVTALLKAEGGESEADPREEPEKPAATVPKEQVAARADEPEPAAVEDKAVAESAAESTPASVPSGGDGLVMVAGRGRPHDAVKEASDKLVEFLRERGVNAGSATGGIPVVLESNMVLPMLLQRGGEEGATSVVLLTADFTGMQKMMLDCYTPAGAELWSLRVSGGTGWTGRESSLTGINENLLERFKSKLESKVGDPCLPVTLR